MPVEDLPRSNPLDPAPPPGDRGETSGEQPPGRVIAPAPPTLWEIVKQVVSNASEHGIVRMAAALAYFAMFSLPALLVFVLALAGLLSSYESVQEQFLSQVEDEVGIKGAEAVGEMIHAAERLRTTSSAALWFGIGSLLFGAVGFFVELQSALNSIFGASPHAPRGLVSTFTLKRILSFAMILGIAVLLLMSLALSALLAMFGERLASWVPRMAPTLLAALDLILNTALLALLFGAVYRVLPDVRVAWRDIRLAALVAAGAFSLGKFGIGTYLAHSTLAIGYGGAGPVIVLLVWTFFSAIVLLSGAEIAKIRAQLREPRLAIGA